MGKKIGSRLLGASNRLTNSTCVFGNMAGLAPTATVRPMFTGLPGYKFARTADNGFHWETNVYLTSEERENGCGLGRSCDDGKNCIKYLNPKKSTAGAYRVGSRMLG
tara:strand:- start:120 stop:440 length:321 start_codon:yes stop_codon:yes gene_type:complete